MGSINSSSVDYWLTKDGLFLLKCWCRDGMKLGDIANNMNISPSLLSQYRKKYPEIDEALKTGKEIVDYRVENALLKSALGFKTKEITVTIGRKKGSDGEWYDILKETKEKVYAPNVTACLAWLNNRKPDAWRRNRDNFVELEDEESDVKITIVRGKNNDLDEDVNTETTIDQKDIEKGKRELKKINNEDPWEGWENW